MLILVLGCSIGVEFGSFCYEVQNEAKSFQDAMDVCSVNGGFLAAVKTKAQQTFIAVKNALGRIIYSLITSSSLM